NFITTNGGTLLTQNPGIPQSQWTDPGIFIDGSLPIAQRFTLKSGFRADWVDTRSHAREVTGTIPIFPGPAGVTLAHSDTKFNPIVFSTSPTDMNLNRHFSLWSAYINGDYKIDEHLSAQAGFGFAQRPPTLTELYATGPFIALLQQGLTRTIGDPHLDPE